ncbi:MAG: SH3 domain-containing protein [Anaerolineae bacterium]|nr:SH3 domain-containing protein [Anaerolineae bacterium]
MKSSDFQSGQQRTMLIVGGIIVLALIGIGMIWVGFRLDNGGRSKERPSPTATSALSGIQPPAGGAVVPTFTPLPTATPPLPTATLQPTSVPEPMIVAQEGGVNLRSGPGTGFSVVGRLEGGASARVTGRYADWWQVDYGGTPAWVANWVVADSNTEGVTEVVPPASPIPSTRVPPTAVPPTAGPPTAVPPTPLPDTRGLQVNHFSVGLKEKKKEEVKPQSAYGNIGDVWFCFEAVNAGGADVTLTDFGAWAQENGHFQASWGGGEGPFEVPAGEAVGMPRWCDHFYNDKDPKFGVGTYNIWLRACFSDGYCVNLAGPVVVNIG